PLPSTRHCGLADADQSSLAPLFQEAKSWANLPAPVSGVSPEMAAGIPVESPFRKKYSKYWTRGPNPSIFVAFRERTDPQPAAARSCFRRRRLQRLATMHEVLDVLNRLAATGKLCQEVTTEALAAPRLRCSAG